VQLRPVADGLMMQQLLYADEVRPMSEIEIQHSPVKEAELKLAVQLIDQISADEFNPKAYEDDVKKRIEAAVEKKISGKEISVSPAAPTGKGAQVIDLMEALRASLNKGTPKPEQAERKPPKRAAAAARPAKAKAARR
jgi:DNA end-binding protein Ku